MDVVIDVRQISITVRREILVKCSFVLSKKKLENAFPFISVNYLNVFNRNKIGKEDV